MNERQIRVHLDKLAKGFGIAALPALVWQSLETAGVIREALDGQIGWEDIEDFAQTRLEMYRGGFEDGRKQPGSLEGTGAETSRAEIGREPPFSQEGGGATPWLTDYEAERASAISEAVAKYATLLHRVRRFRTRFLDDRVLTAEEARAFLASPALALFMAHDCEEGRIPFVGHTAVVERVEPAALAGVRHGEQVYIHVTPPGITHSFGCFVDARLALPVATPDGEHMVIDVRRHSVLDELRQLAMYLASLCGWNEEAAAWFVLTDAVPFVAPLQTSVKMSMGNPRNKARITLSAEPWVSAETVVRIHRDLQRRVLGCTDNRPIGRRALALFRLGVEHLRANKRPSALAKRPSGRELMERWNALHPAACSHRSRHDDQCRYENEGRLSGDFERVWRALMHPPFNV